MHEVPVRVVDSFTTVPFGGNPAGVVLEAEGLSEASMQAIAREVNASETAFLLGTQRDDADLRIRWFSPSTEIPLCGHGTVAAFHAAMEQGKLAAGTFRMECGAGVLPVTLERGADGRPAVSLGLPVPRLTDSPLSADVIAGCLGIAQGQIDMGLGLARTGDWLIVPVTGLDALRRLKPDFRAIRAAGDGASVGSWIILSTGTVEPESAVHIRMLAPAFGIDEDPVTGSAQGPLAAYLVARGLLPHASGLASGYRYQAEQGDLIGRPGRIQVAVELEGGAESSSIASITITGRAVTVMRGALMLGA